MLLHLALVTTLNMPFDVAGWETQRLQTQRVGMTVLGSWAVANIVAGGIVFGVAREQRTKWFGLGNLLWNTVNLTLAVLSLASEWNANPSAVEAKPALAANQKNEKILWFNAGLDVAYMATAAFLWQRGSTSPDERMVGAGQALLLQGAFLLIFDVTLALLHGRLNDALLAGVTLTL